MYSWAAVRSLAVFRLTTRGQDNPKVQLNANQFSCLSFPFQSNQAKITYFTNPPRSSHPLPRILLPPFRFYPLARKIEICLRVNTLLSYFIENQHNLIVTLVSFSAQEARAVSDNCIWEFLKELYHISWSSTCNFLRVVVHSSLNFAEEKLKWKHSTDDLTKPTCS